MTEWVKCTERMPAVDSIVMIRGHNGMMGFARAAGGPSGYRWWDAYSVDGFDWRWKFEMDYEDDAFLGVTHWAPCPEQPGDV